MIVDAPDIPVLYADNHLLVLVKPAGMLSQEDHTGDLDILTWGKAWVKKEYDKPGNVFLGLVHRLDRPASGVMVFARTSKAAARLSEQFRTRTVEKEYLALVEGRLEGSGRWTDHLVKEDRTVRTAEPAESGAREARLAWRSLGVHDDMTLLEIRLETGRPHQVRVQCASREYPLVGDMRYGATCELDGKNLALHEVRLAIDHPTRKERMSWAAPLPATWPAWARAASIK